MLKLLELVSESLIDDDAVLARRTPPAEKEAGERLTCCNSMRVDWDIFFFGRHVFFGLK